MREIEEETGIGKMEIIHKLGVTRHTYRSNVGKRIIKKSHWYLIETVKQKLKPQVTEDIEKAQWMTLDTFLEKKKSLPKYSGCNTHTDGGKNRGQIKVKIK